MIDIDRLADRLTDSEVQNRQKLVIGIENTAPEPLSVELLDEQHLAVVQPNRRMKLQMGS